MYPEEYGRRRIEVVASGRDGGPIVTEHTRALKALEGLTFEQLREIAGNEHESDLKAAAITP